MPALSRVEGAEAMLALADGTVYKGTSCGAEGETAGEVVFNTSLTGYPEVLTDPSYKGQIVTMTYPLIGNYGLNEEDFESRGPMVEGFIVKEASPYPSSWRSKTGLSDFLRKHGIVGIQGIDTRALTRRIRQRGVIEGAISTVDRDPESLLAKARTCPGLIGRDLIKEVTCQSSYEWDKGTWRLESGYLHPIPEARFSVVALDFGIKFNILRKLIEHGCRVTVVPASTSAAEILRRNPDGIFLSNGPGDPAAVPYAVDTVRQLLGKKPIFGICLGHQILGQAFGGSTYKLKFGHRGGNHPVLNRHTGQVEITAQNHGFAVDAESLPSEVELTHVNLNDHTLEGMRHREMPVFSVQYHPEASPGPHDAGYLFSRFIDLMKGA